MALVADEREAAPPVLTPPFPPGRAPSVIACPGPSAGSNSMKSMNGQHENQQPTESLDDEFERLEIRKLRLDAQLIEAGMRRHRFRLMLDIVMRSAIATAVVLAVVAADHIGVF